MKRAMIILLVGITLGLGIAGPAAATGLDDDEAWRTLVGVAPLGVVVAQLPAAAERHGLQRDTIQADVEQFLRERRVKVVPQDERRERETAYVRVRCDLIRLVKEERFVYAIEIDLLQPATLASGQRVHASTWSECQAGVTRRLSPDDVRAAVIDAAGAFVNAYVEANPQPQKKKP